MARKNALYAQSGGVTAVINATACGVIETARQYPDQIGAIYGARNGVLGVLREELVDTSNWTQGVVADLRFTPGGVFGTCRYKLGDMDQQRHKYERLIEVLAAHDIGYFFYNGGNDSADTAWKVSQLGETLGYPVQCIGIPKTIDNDLPETDNCPGFGSAAKYVAVSIMEAGLDVRAMAETSTKVFVMEVMGRHAGWLAAAAGLAKRHPDDPPHLILFPEVPFDQSEFLSRVEQAVDRHEFCTVVVSEGTKNAAGQFLSGSTMKDAFGHTQLGGAGPWIAQLISQESGLKVHWAVLDYLQRSARHLASRTDLEHAYAVGRHGVELAVAGENSVMPIIERVSDSPYQWRVSRTHLSEVANREKTMPPEFITEDGYGISEACRRYIEPLIQGEAYPPYRDGLPRYRQWNLTPVEPRLERFQP